MNEERKTSIDQFGAMASRYVKSPVHAQGLTLKRVIELANPQKGDVVLDVATGAGHMAIAMAPYVSTIFATDITPQMLHEARKLAGAKGLANIKFEIAAAEALPYPGNTFDIVTCRIAAHHFADAAAFVKEAARVLKPDGLLAVVDDTVPEAPEIDRFLNDIEFRRDRSHIRNYTPSEWRAFFVAASLQIQALEVTIDLEEGMSFDTWMHRAGASPEVTEEVRRDVLSGPEAARQAYNVRFVEADLRLEIPKIVIVGRKAI